MFTTGLSTTVAVSLLALRGVSERERERHESRTKDETRDHDENTTTGSSSLLQQRVHALPIPARLEHARASTRSCSSSDRASQTRGTTAKALRYHRNDRIDRSERAANAHASAVVGQLRRTPRPPTAPKARPKSLLTLWAIASVAAIHHWKLAQTRGDEA